MVVKFIFKEFILLHCTTEGGTFIPLPNNVTGKEEFSAVKF